MTKRTDWAVELEVRPAGKRGRVLRTLAEKTRDFVEAKEPKYKLRQHNRCQVCGRPRAFLRKVGICRNCFRSLAPKDEIPSGFRSKGKLGDASGRKPATGLQVDRQQPPRMHKASVPKVSATQRIEAEMKATAMREILNNGDYLRPEEISDLATARGASRLQKWKRDRRIFALADDKRGDVIPRFLLDPASRFQPYKVVPEVLAILRDKDAWGLAFWFSSLNGLLGGKRPQDLVASEPDRVIAAAKDQVLGPQHG